MTRLLNWFTNLFPVWVLALGAVALWHPAAFLWFKTSYISWALAVIMLARAR